MVGQVVQYYGRKAVQRALRWFVRTDTLSEDINVIVAAIRRQGYYVTDLWSLERLGGGGGTETPFADALLTESDCLYAQERQAGRGSKSYVSHINGAVLMGALATIRWPLDTAILAIARAYIGLPVRYRGLAARIDHADGSQLETRMWHLDGEDDRILKAIVYLNDIDESGGPFTLVPRDRLPENFPYGGARLADEQMDAIVPHHDQVTCVGKRGTVVLVDTCAIFHKGAVPVTGDRKALFYAFNSAFPLRPHYCEPLVDWSELRKELPPTLEKVLA